MLGACYAKSIMLSASHRFHGHGSLNYLFRNGRVFRGGKFILRYVDNKRRDDSRFSIIVGKKVSKSAVVRNRIRRRVYEVIRKHLGSLSKQVDVAVTVLVADVAVMPAAEVEETIVGLLRQAGLYKPPQ